MTALSFSRPLPKYRFIPANKSCSQIRRSGLINRRSLFQRERILLSKKSDLFLEQNSGLKIFLRIFWASFPKQKVVTNMSVERPTPATFEQMWCWQKKEERGSRQLEEEAFKGLPPRCSADSTQAGMPGGIFTVKAHPSFDCLHSLPRLLDEDSKRSLTRCH